MRSSGSKGLLDHQNLSNKDVSGVINHGDGSVTEVKLDQAAMVDLVNSDYIEGQMFPGLGATGVFASGLCNGANASGTITNANLAGGRRAKQYATGAVINTNAGCVNGSFEQFNRTQNPRMELIFSLGSATSVRLWAGFFSASPMTTGTPGAGGTSYFGLRADTGVANTNFVAASGDGVADNLQDFGAGNTIDTDVHKLVIQVNNGGTSVTITLDGVSVTLSTNLPAAGNTLNFIFSIQNLAAADKQLVFFGFKVRIDRVPA